MPIEFSSVIRSMKEEGLRLGLAQNQLPSTGSYNLDVLIGSAYEKSLILIVGMPGSGKTLLARHIKNTFAKSNHSCKLLDEWIENPKEAYSVVRSECSLHDFVIATVQSRERIGTELMSDKICVSPLSLMYMASYAIMVSREKDEREIVLKVECNKNRHGRRMNPFWLQVTGDLRNPRITDL